MLDRQTIRLQNNEEYTVFVGEHTEPEFRKLAASAESRKALFFVDENVYRLQADLVNFLKSLFNEPYEYIIPAGEPSKSLQQWYSLVDFALNCGVTRNTPVFAIGGGVTGDLSGYAASSIMRGLPLVHVPTTLLATVDSAIGGKTGINHTSGKNLIGSFYQPRAVVAPLRCLDTLPDEEFVCGFGEVLKYGAIADPDILNILKGKDLLSLRENTSLLGTLIQRSIKVKADVVMKDTRESSLRMILNYGHTFAHALEKICGYGTISHGQAVYMGMIAAGILSTELGADISASLIEQHHRAMGMEQAPLHISGRELTAAMQSDKKKQSDTLRFVVLKKYGRPYIESVKDTVMIEKTWDQATARIKELNES